MAAVGALVQEQLSDLGDFRGPQLKADRAEGEAERAAQPLGIADAERGEQPGHQELAQVEPVIEWTTRPRT